MYGRIQIKFATGHPFLLPGCLVVCASAWRLSQATLKAQAGKRKHQLLRRVVCLPWRHWIEAVRLDLGPGLPVRKACGRQSGGEGGGWRARGAFVHGMLSKQMCPRSWKRGSRGPRGLARAVPTRRRVGGGPATAWPEGGGWGAGPARALSAVRPTRGRDGRPPERAAGPSVRAAGAYWSAGRRGRGPGCSSRWAAPAPLPRRPCRSQRLGPRSD